MSVSSAIARFKGYPKRWYLILVVVVILVIAAALRLYNVTSHRLIYGDESLISYVPFAWMKYGAMPYRDIWAPQSYNPITFVLYQLSYQIFGFNALAIRMIVVVPGIISVLLIYLIGRKLFGRTAGLVGAFIYAVYIPFSVELEHSYSSGHALVNMLSLAVILVLLKAVNSEKKTYSDMLIAVSGILIFLASTMKPYYFPIFFVALGIIAHVHGFKLKELVRPWLILIGTFIGAFCLLILYLYLNGALESWIRLFLIGPLAISNIPLGAIVVRWEEFFVRTLFVLMFAIPTIIWGFVKRKKEVVYLFFWSLFPLLVISLGSFGPQSLLAAFSPLLILSSVSIAWLLGQTILKTKAKDWNAVLPVAVLILALFASNAYTNFPNYATALYSVDPHVDGQISVGAAIANLTSPTDKIFTTDTAFAMLSQREVITVGSIKAAGFYSDLMGYSYETHFGIPGYPEGIINNDMILSALELNKPKLIIINRHELFGIVDEIIWTGGQEQIYRPLGPYIMEHYSLNTTIESGNYRWEIWSYDPSSSQELNVFSNQSGVIQVGSQIVSATLSFQSNNVNYSYYESINQSMPADQFSTLSINYTFPVQKHAFVIPTIDFSDNINIANYKSISFWVKGDNSSNNLWLDLTDSADRAVGIAVRSLNFLGWKNVVVSLDSFANQGIDISAIKRVRISIDNNSEHTGSGTVNLAHLELWSYVPTNYQELNVLSDQGNIVQVGSQVVSSSLGFQSNNCNFSSYASSDPYMSADLSSSLSINYSFPVGQHAFVVPTVEFGDNVDFSGYKSVSFWVKGDNSSNVLWLDLTDSTGNSVGVAIRSLNFLGWTNIIVSLDSFAKQGIKTSAINRIRISIDNNSGNTGSGTVTLAHLALLS